MCLRNNQRKWVVKVELRERMFWQEGGTLGEWVLGKKISSSREK